jgi:hypothetical protein
MCRMKTPVIAAVALLVSALPALAHHSNSAFQVDKVIELKGVVSQWKWMNPHVWIGLTVDDGRGGKAEWAIEGRPPGVLSRAGWSKNILHVGDTVTIHFSPAKDGSRTGLVARVTLADGTVLGNAGPQ